MFNALEETILQVDEWKVMEKQLQAVCHIVSEPSSKSLVLEKLYQGAPWQERALVEAFSSKLLNWRWQSLQQVVEEWFGVYASLKERWDPTVFPDTNSKHVELVTESLSSSWHHLFLSWLCSFAGSVGREATWFEGCYCHSHVLVSQANRWSRKKAMVQANCPTGNCIWQGRRLPSLALGHAADLCNRIMNASSWQYTATLLASDQHNSHRMAEIDVQCKTKFCQIVEHKLKPFQSLPYVLVGAFGEYCGYALVAAKKAVQDGIAEYEAMAPHNKDSVSALLLEHDHAVSAQLRAFAAQSDRSLHDFPDAFLALRARAFALCVERHTEGEHARVKFHAQRGFRFAGPVMVAARKRKAEVLQMIESHMHWLTDVWHAQKLFVNLLEHVLPKEQIQNLTFAQRCQRVYACNPKDQFSDLSKWELEAAAFHKSVKKVQQALDDGARVLPNEAMQVVYLIKHFLPNGVFASVPKELWRAATCSSPGAQDAPPPMQPLVLESAMLSGKLGSPNLLQQHVFFSVLDARPEAKVVVKLRKSRPEPTLLYVSHFAEVSWCWKESNVAMLNVQGRQSCVLNLCEWTQPLLFKEFCQNATVWKAGCSELQLNLCPASSVASEPLLLPDVLLEDDSLHALLAVDTAEEKAVASYQQGVQDLQMSVAVQGRSLREQERATLMSLVRKKAFGPDAACGLWDMPYFETAALQAMKSLGIVSCEQDDLGDDRYWLTDACHVSPAMRLEDPMPLLEGFYTTTGIRQRSKRSCRLAFVLALLQDGWSMKKWKPTIKWHYQGKEKILCDQVWKRPEAYFKAMLLCDLVFDRPGGLSKIHHLAPASYYTDLLAAANTQAFTGLQEDQCVNYKPAAKKKKTCPRPGFSSSWRGILGASR